jgi:hypothetical protein
VKTTAWTFGVAVDPVHKLLQLVGDIEAEQAVRAAVDPDDQDGSAALHLEVALVFVCHGLSPLLGRPAPITKSRRRARELGGSLAG